MLLRGMAPNVVARFSATLAVGASASADLIRGGEHRRSGVEWRTRCVCETELEVAAMQWWWWLIIAVVVIAVVIGVFLAVQARRRTGGVIMTDPGPQNPQDPR